MRLQVLLSAMFLKDEGYIDSLNITSDAVVINQCDSCLERGSVRRNINGKDQKVVYVETKERGSYMV